MTESDTPLESMTTGLVEQSLKAAAMPKASDLPAGHRRSGRIQDESGNIISEPAPRDESAPEEHEVEVTKHQAKTIADSWLPEGDVKCLHHKPRCTMALKLGTQRFVIFEASWWRCLRALQGELIRRGHFNKPTEREPEAFGHPDEDLRS